MVGLRLEDSLEIFQTRNKYAKQSSPTVYTDNIFINGFQIKP
jgi:hypothetical protein